MSTIGHILESFHGLAGWFLPMGLLLLSGCADEPWFVTSDHDSGPWPEPIVVVIGESPSEMIDTMIDPAEIEASTDANRVAPQHNQPPHPIAHRAARPILIDSYNLDNKPFHDDSIQPATHHSATRESMRMAHALLANPPAGRLIDSEQSADEFTPMATAQEPANWSVQRPHKPWKYVVLHHTATLSGDVESIHQSHLKNKDRLGNRWLGIGYHFVIGNGIGMPDGEIAPTFRWNQQMPGAHAGNKEFNDYGIGIVLVGNFARNPPTLAQVGATKRLVSHLASEFEIDSSSIIGHGSVRATECPGRYFPMDVVKKSIRFGHEDLPDAEPPHSVPPEKSAAATPRRTKGSNSQ